MGKLFVVATPIGNLGDITYRAVETLRDVAVIAAEDTRQTRKLVQRYEIDTPLMSYHAHSGGSREQQLLDRLAAGDDVALVTDAGTPAVADPGSRLVDAVRTAGHTVVPIPGPAAVTAAISASGLGGDSFTFIGFLPHKKGRQTQLDALARHTQPVVLYESTHRLLKLLGELEVRYATATVQVARELTKQFEEIRQGTPAELLEWYTAHPPKGEIVVVMKLAS